MDFDRRFGDVAHPELIRLARYWRELAGPRLLPQQGDFRPSQVLRWLPGRLYVIDVLHGGADYRFRLFGEGFQMLTGYDLTGQLLSEIEASSARLNTLRPHFDAIVKTRFPIYWPGTIIWPSGESIYHQRLLVPLASAEGGVSMILGAMWCEMTNKDLVVYRGLGLPKLVLDAPVVLAPSGAQSQDDLAALAV